MATKKFICPHCGEKHPGLPTDWGFKSPDEIHRLPYLDTYARVRMNSDLATLDEKRHFIRGVLPIPFASEEGYFGWGIWVEVSKKDHNKYLKFFDEDASNQARVIGCVANKLPGYSNTVGLEVEVQFGDSGKRPTFWLPSRSRHTLAKEQSSGIDSKRHHDLLEAGGYFERDA